MSVCACVCVGERERETERESVFGALGWCVSVRDSSSCAIAGVEKRESVRNPITTAFNSDRLSLDTHTHTHTYRHIHTYTYTHTHHTHTHTQRKQRCWGSPL